jgi:hypothetical protein
MIRRALALTACLAALGTTRTVAQQQSAQPPSPRATTPAPAPAAAPKAQTAPPPRRQLQPINVKIDFTLMDQHGGGPATKRSLTLVVSDGMSGSIRSQSDVMGVGGGVTLNIDTSPELLPDGKIRVGFTIQYDWPGATDGGRETARGTVLKTAMRQSISLILENGKPMVATQSADATGDRQVSAEVKATILK